MVHGSVHSLFRVLGAIATLLIFGLAGLAWRLSNGPIAVDFLAPYLADSFTFNESVQLDIRGAEVTWSGFQNTPVIRLADIVALNQDGHVLAEFPDMTVRLSLLSILEGVPAPEEIILANPTIRLTRLKSGEVVFLVAVAPEDSIEDLGITDEEDVSSGTDVSTTFLIQSAIQSLIDPGGTQNLPGYLERATIRDAQVIFVDELSGSDWFVPSGSIDLVRVDDSLRIQSILPYSRDDRRSEIRIGGYYNAANEGLDLSIDFDDLKPSLFSSLFPNVPYLSGIDLDVDGVIDVSAQLSGTSALLTSAQLSILGGRGDIYLPSPIDRTYPVMDLTFEANLTDRFQVFTVPAFELQLEGDEDAGVNVSITVEGSQVDTQTQAVVGIDIDALTLEELTRYWPEEIKPNTRKWIAQNLTGGTVHGVRFDLELGGEDANALDVVSFSGGGQLNAIDVTYMRQMPPVKSTSGDLQLGLSEVVIDITEGHVDHSVFEQQLKVQSGRVRLHGLDTKSHLADIDLRVDGLLHDAVALIDQEPLRYSSALGISPAAVGGETQVLLGIDFPLIQDLSLDQISISAQASLTATSITDAAFGLDLAAGQFSLTLDNGGMDVVGTAGIGGIRTGLAWRENFTDDTAFKRQYALDAVIENDQRDLIGLNMPLFHPPYVDGPLRIEAIYTVDRNGLSDLAIEAELSDATIAVPQLSWSKPPDVPALFAASIQLENEQIRAINTFSIESDATELMVRGRAQFSADSQLDRFVLEPSSIGKNEFSVEAFRGADGILGISLTGDVLDGTSFWSSLRQSDTTRSFQQREVIEERIPFNFEGQINRLLLSSQGEMTEVTATVAQETSGLSYIDLSGLVGDEDAFTLSLVTEGEDRRFTAEGENGGAVLKALGLGDDFVEGKLTVSGALKKTGAVTGQFNIESFRIVDAPLLARLLSVASLTGIVDELQGGGISFSELNLPFTYFGNVFSIEDGAMYGSSLGLTAEGQYDLNQNTLEGEGTLIPAYALNSAFGSIPILGPILTGGEESGGVFAATYTMRGSPESGEITVNPLATLTPGFLRQIFKVFEPPRTTASPVESPGTE